MSIGETNITNKVWIVTDGSCEDYHIVGVFSNEKAAIDFANNEKMDNVEEYEMDACTIDVSCPTYYQFTFFELEDRNEFCFFNETRTKDGNPKVTKSCTGALYVSVSLLEDDIVKAESIAHNVLADYKALEGR